MVVISITNKPGRYLSGVSGPSSTGATRLSTYHMAGVHHLLIGLKAGKYSADNQRGMPGRLMGDLSLPRGDD